MVANSTGLDLGEFGCTKLTVRLHKENICRLPGGLKFYTKSDMDM